MRFVVLEGAARSTDSAAADGVCVRTGAAELSLLVVLVSRVITWLLVTEAAV